MTPRPDPDFMAAMRGLEAAYLEALDAEGRSGFGGGRERWVAERSPLVEAIDRDGDFLDVGCANGLLAADAVVWAARRGSHIVPYGIDLGPGLVAEAQARLGALGGAAWKADAWRWAPSRRWTFVYSLVDLAPGELAAAWVRRLVGWVEPGGRVILGSYGSRSRDIDPVDAGAVLRRAGFDVAGEAVGGDPPVSRFAWVSTGSRNPPSPQGDR